MNKKEVSIRKQNNDYLAYFYNQRITLKVNQIGAEILNEFLNKNKDINYISNKISKKYNVNIEEAQQDTINFLKDIYNKLTNINYSNIEQQLLDYPLGAEVEITTACNLRCKHCFQNDYSENYMSFEKFKEVIDILVDNNVCEINLVGGEIFKHNDILKFLDYLNKKDLAVTIVTNAVLINQDILNFLKNMDNLIVLVSLDGTRKLHDAIRGKGQFDLIFPKINQIKNAGIKVEILCTLNSINVNHVDEIVALGEETQIPVNFNLFKPFAPEHQSLIVNPNDYFSVLEKLVNMRINGNSQIGISNASITSYLMGLPVLNECTATLSGLVINTQGKMLTCPYLLECGYYSENELPEFNESFLEVWKNHPIFKEFRKNGLKGCQARSLIFSNDIKLGDPYDIDSFKNYQKKKLKNNDRC